MIILPFRSSYRRARMSGCFHRDTVRQLHYAAAPLFQRSLKGQPGVQLWDRLDSSLTRPCNEAYAKFRRAPQKALVGGAFVAQVKTFCISLNGRKSLCHRG